MFPSEESLKRLVGAVVCEQDEQWSGSCYFAADKIQQLYDEKRAEEPAGAARPESELARIARQVIEASRACRQGRCSVECTSRSRV